MQYKLSYLFYNLNLIGRLEDWNVGILEDCIQ